MKRLSAIFIAGSLLMGSMGSASAATSMIEEGGIFETKNFSATLTFTTNYTYRGTTFSANDPAIQGSFDWGYGPWFAGAWASSLTGQDVSDDFTRLAEGANMEIDYYFGWADNLGGFDLMVMPLFYTFPGQNSDNARDDATFELWTSVGRSFADIPGSPTVGLAFDWSPEYFDGGDSSYHIKPSIALVLPMGFGLDFAYGYTDVGGVGGNEFFGDDYSYIELGLTKSLVGFDLVFSYMDNLDEDDIGEGFALDDEFVFTASRSF